VWIWTIKIGFDPAVDSIRIRSTKIGFDPNSVLESVRTLVLGQWQQAVSGKALKDSKSNKILSRCDPPITRDGRNNIIKVHITCISKQILLYIVYFMYIRFCMSRRLCKMCIGHTCLSVSDAACPHYRTSIPQINLGNGRQCPLVVHYWTDLHWIGAWVMAFMAMTTYCDLSSANAWVYICVSVYPQPHAHTTARTRL